MQSNIVTARQIRALEGPYLKWISGSEEAQARSISTPDKLSGQPADQLVFIAKSEGLKKALLSATLLIVENTVATDDIQLSPQQAIWKTPSLKAAMIQVLPLFDPLVAIRQNEPEISPGAHIHPTAKIGTGTRIAPGAVVEAHAEIGSHCTLHPGAVVRAFCRVGNHCVLHANSVIGSDGFGFATDPQGHHHRVPQIGITLLEDNVEIGAGTTIDRATIGETKIGQGTKFDNHCHVGHNCVIGKHSIFAGGFMIAGSTVVGDHFMGGGASIISDHVTICDRVVLGGRATVTKDITAPGAYTGYPLEPLKDGLKTVQNLKHLTKMRQQLKLVSKRLGITEDQG